MRQRHLRTRRASLASPSFPGNGERCGTHAKFAFVTASCRMQGCDRRLIGGFPFPSASCAPSISSHVPFFPFFYGDYLKRIEASSGRTGEHPPRLGRVLVCLSLIFFSSSLRWCCCSIYPSFFLDRRDWAKSWTTRCAEDLRSECQSTQMQQCHPAPSMGGGGLFFPLFSPQRGQAAEKGA